MGVVDQSLECDAGPGIDVIVSVWKFHGEFEDCIGVEASAEEDYAVE